MRFRTSTSRRLLAVAVVSALICALSAGAIGQAGAAPSAAPRAHTAASYLTGLGDEQQRMFVNPLYQQLHTKIVRYVAPYDAIAHPYSLALASAFIRSAEVAHEQVLVAFYHSEYAPTRLPSVAQYQRDVQKFVKRFPHVRQYESWDESNRGNVANLFSSPSAVAAAQYYQGLRRVCPGCTVIGLDVLDAASIGPTLTYIAEFKREVKHLETIMPTIWGLHNYSDINRLESWRTRELIHALGGQVWLTETGGIVQFGGSFPNRNGAGLTRAAKVLKFMFSVAASQPQVKRLYIYDWNGGTRSTRFDAGLTNSREQPREGYVVVCRALRATKCGVKIAKN